MDIYERGSRVASPSDAGTYTPTKVGPSQQATALVDKGPAPLQGAFIDGYDQAKA